MMSEETTTGAGLVGEARWIRSLLLTLWPVGRRTELECLESSGRAEGVRAHDRASRERPGGL
jgi:hypothetical protein